METYNPTDNIPENQEQETPPLAYPPATIRITAPLEPADVTPPRNRRLEYFIFASLLLTGLTYVILSLFVNHIQIKEDAGVAPTRRVQDLVNLLTQAETKQKKLEKELSKLKKRLTVIQQNPEAALPAEEMDKANPEYQKLLKLGGFTAVTGPGISVILDDTKHPIERETSQRPGSTQNSVQSEDLLKLINDLKAAGATALSINGQRIVTTTEIVNAGPSIIINQTRINSPFQIRALGTPATLHASLALRGGILEYLQFFGIQARIEEKEALQIPAYNGPIPQ